MRQVVQNVASDGALAQLAAEVHNLAQHVEHAAVTAAQNNGGDALAKLAPVDRMIVLLREMEGLSTREVAEITTMSEDNVKTRLHRARARLREVLKEA